MIATLIAVIVDNIFIAVYQVGQILMKLTVLKHYEGPNPTARSKCFNTFMWFVGFGSCGVSQFVHVACLPFIDLIMMSTMVTTALLSGYFFSICWLKEPYNIKYDIPATILIIIGSILLVLMTNKETEKYKTEQFEDILF